MKLPFALRRLIARIEAGTSGYLCQVGWIESRATLQSVDKTGAPIPWFTYPAISFLGGRVKPDWAVLEFGAGAGTLWWSARTSNVTAIEHSPVWAGIVSARCKADLLVVASDTAEDYLSLGSSLGPYDVIIVDGLFREDCLRRAPALLAPAGIIILDDSQREEYREAVQELCDLGFRALALHGPQPVSKHPGCTTFFYRAENVLAL